VLTTGIGSSSAGLTTSAVRDGGVWNLEAGALVLADGGVCCIDEFGTISEHDRACIHEAMEQQTLSVAKAGLVCKLQTKCSVLAASNPKGKYDPTQPLTVNAAVASPLLSRFDLVFVLLDNQSKEWDEMVSQYVLDGDQPHPQGQPVWSIEKLQVSIKYLAMMLLTDFGQAYFSYCKQFKPELGEDASTVLVAYYRSQRSADCVSSSRTTVRLLQSAIRLAEGHARLLTRNEVTVEDAIAAVTLLEAGAESGQVINGSPLRNAFPKDPIAEYSDRAKTILTKLGLDYLWTSELARLNGQNGASRKAPLEEKRQPMRKEDMLMTQVMSKIRAIPVKYGGQTTAPEPLTKPNKRKVTEMLRNKKKRKQSDDNEAPNKKRPLAKDSSLATSTQVPRSSGFSSDEEEAERLLPCDISAVSRPGLLSKHQMSPENGTSPTGSVSKDVESSYEKTCVKLKAFACSQEELNKKKNICSRKPETFKLTLPEVDLSNLNKTETTVSGNYNVMEEGKTIFGDDEDDFE